MDGSVLKKTRESLGKVIKKPPLTDKLLSKPPFRFLHDIITEVIRTTGFMKGLYTDADMKSENVKERDSKMAFLQKAIDVVVMVSGESLSAKPARIVAGHEPERTNELLQAIATCCLNKMSSEDAVKRVLSGDKAEAKPKTGGSKAQPRETKDTKETREEQETAAQSEEKSRRTKPEETRDRQKNGDSRQKEQREGESKERRDQREERERRDRDKGKEKTRSNDKEREQHRRDDRERDRDKDKHREKDRDKDRERDKEKEREREKEKERERRRRDRDRDQDRTKSKPREDDSKTQVKTEEPPQNISPEEPPRATTETSARIPRPSSAKGQRRRAPVGSQDESDSEGDGDTAQKPAEPSTEAPPASTDAAAAPSRRTVRPSSARPAPPRAKRQESHTEPPAERLSSAKPTAVILDGAGAEEEQNNEDEQFLVQEAVPAATETPDPDSATATTEGDATHGGLVKKILETKKYYEVSPSSPKAQVASSESGLKERDLVRREIERLRSSVQTVCRSALPLGKIMDYIQEDVDAMAAELQQWRQESRENGAALEQERRLTELALQPLHSELSELEQMIQEQQSQICALRCSILRNEHKINKMLTGVHHGNGV